MRRKPIHLPLAFLLLGTGLLTGCGKTIAHQTLNAGALTRVEPVEQDPEWLRDPDSVQGYAAVGEAVILSSEGIARRHATEVAREKLALSMRATIEGIAEAWTEGGASLVHGSSMASLLTSEGFVRSVIQPLVEEAVVKEYRVKRGHVYALVELREPEDWLSHLVQRVDEEVGGRRGALNTIPQGEGAGSVVAIGTRAQVAEDGGLGW